MRVNLNSRELRILARRARAPRKQSDTLQWLAAVIVLAASLTVTGSAFAKDDQSRDVQLVHTAAVYPDLIRARSSLQPEAMPVQFDRRCLQEVSARPGRAFIQDNARRNARIRWRQLIRRTPQMGERYAIWDYSIRHLQPGCEGPAGYCCFKRFQNGRWICHAVATPCDGPPG